MLKANHEEEKLFQEKVNTCINRSLKEQKIPENYKNILNDESVSDEEKSELGGKITELQLKAAEEIYSSIEKTSAEKIADQLDIICLQEFYREDRPFSLTLQSKGFKIYHHPDSKDTAIAVRTVLFSNIQQNHWRTEKPENTSFGQDIASVSLTFNDKSITVASIHSWGFTLYNPKLSENRKYSNFEKERMDLAKKYIDNACKLVLSQRTNYSVIAGDFNNNPENFADPFESLANSGHRLLPMKGCTNVNYMCKNYLHRSIDFICVKKPKQNLINQFQSLFSKSKEAKVLEGFSFTCEGNSSDHLPIGAFIDVKKNN